MESFQQLAKKQESELERLRKERANAAGGGASLAAVQAIQAQLGGFASQADVTNAIAQATAAADAAVAAQAAAQATFDAAQDAARAQLAADQDAVDAAQDAAQAAEEVQDGVEEAQTDSEQATQDTAIAAAQSAATQANNNISALDAAVTAQQSTQDGRLTALENEPDVSLTSDEPELIAIDDADPKNLVLRTPGIRRTNRQGFGVQDDSNIDLFVVDRSTDGSGIVSARGSVTGSGKLEITAPTGNAVRIDTPAGLSQDYSVTLPIAGTNKHSFLSTSDNAENTQWAPSPLWQNGNLIPGGNRAREQSEDLYPLSADRQDSQGFARTATGDRSPLSPLPLIKTGLVGNQTIYGLGDISNRLPVNSISERERYISGTEFRITDWVGTGNPDVRLYTGWQFTDAVGSGVSYLNSQFIVASLQNLVNPLNPGDTTIEVGDTAAWSTSTSVTFRVAVANYVDNSGYNWGPTGYTRTVVNLQIVSKTATTLTLSGPWTGPAVAVGEPVRQTVSTGGSYRYIGWGAEPLQDGQGWQYREGILHPTTAVTDTVAVGGDAILSGAAAMRLVILVRPRDLAATFSLSIGLLTLKSALLP